MLRSRIHHCGEVVPGGREAAGGKGELGGETEGFPHLYPLRNGVGLENLVFPMISAAGAGVGAPLGCGAAAAAVSWGSCFPCLNLCRGSISVSSGVPRKQSFTLRAHGPGLSGSMGMWGG